MDIKGKTTKITMEVVSSFFLLLFICQLAYGTVTATNGIYTLSVEDQLESSGVGTYTVATGANHPNPDQNVLYGGASQSPGSTYLTIRSFTTGTDYVSSMGSGITSSYTLVRLDSFSPTVAPLGSTGFSTEWNVTGPDHLRIVQETVIEGTTYEDSRVRVTTTVTNTGNEPVEIGIRYQWDWQIDGADDSWFRTIDPDGSFTDVFASFEPPNFTAYEETDNPDSPTFSIYGTVNGPTTLSPAPTPPDKLTYNHWEDAFFNAWDFTVTGSGEDSGVCYYWFPITLNPGESISVTQYITTSIEVVQPTVTSVPTMTEWGMVIFMVMTGLIAVYSLRRYYL